MEPSVKGAVERMVFGHLVGWARRTDGDERETLVVSVNGTDVAETVANLPRPDLEKKGVGDGRYGFVVALARGAFDETGENVVRVRSKASGKELNGSPLVTDLSQSSGWLGHVRGGHLYGWVTPQLPIFRHVTVDLVVDGKSRGQFQPTLLRDDLGSFGLAALPAGLRVALPADVMDGKEHRIELWAVNQPHPLRGSPKTFRAEPDETISAQPPAAIPAPQPTDLLLAADDHAKHGRYEEAVTLLDQVLAIDPSHREALASKAALLEQCSDKERLVTHLAAALGHFPKNLPWRMRYIALRRERGAQAWALDASAAVTGEFPDKLRPILQAASSARALGLPTVALEWFRQGVAISDEGNAAIQCAKECLHFGKPDQARDWLDSIPPGSEAAAQLPWLQIVVAMHTAPAEATQQYLQLLRTETSPDQRARLMAQGRGLGLPVEVETVLQTPGAAGDDTGCWTLHAQRVRNLLDLGQRRAARALLQAYSDEKLAAVELIESADLWHAACCISQAKALLHKGARQLLTMQIPTTEELETTLRICHQLGEQPLRDEIFRQTYHPGAWQPIPKAMPQALRLCQDGRLADAEQLINTEAGLNSDLPVARARAKLSHHSHRYHDATEILKEQISGPLVALEDTRLWIRSLIDAEEMTQAEAELDRLQAHYAESDIAPLRAEILSKNLRFEEAIECLRAAHHHYPLDQKIAEDLAAALLDYGELSEAATLIEPNLIRRPANLAWGELQLQWMLARSAEWGPWQETHRRLQQRMSYADRLNLRMSHLQMLMNMRQHDRAEHLLRHFTRELPKMALPKRNVGGFALRAAHLWTGLQQPETCAEILARLEASGLRDGQKDIFYRISAFNEAFWSRDAQRVVALNNQIGNSRHHMTLTTLPPAPTGDAPPLRVAVLIHLFYQDIWPEIRHYLRSLRGTQFRLFVSVPSGQVAQHVLDELKAVDANVRILVTENRGFDVGGHWQSLDQVNLADFDLALLLQTKKSTHFKVGPLWRDNLMKALLGTPARWHETLHAFANNPQAGLAGSALHRFSTDPWNYKEMREVVEALGMPSQFDELKHCYEFVGGTMFLIRANLLQEMHAKTRKRLVFDHYDDLSVAKRLDRSRAHAMERAFGMYTRWRGYQIVWLS